MEPEPAANAEEETKPTGAPGEGAGNGDRATDPTMEENREVAVGTGRQLPSPAERRGGKAAGELPQRVNAADGDERVRQGNLHDDGVTGLQGTAQRGGLLGDERREAQRGAAERGDGRAGGESLPVVHRDDREIVPRTTTTAIGGGNASKGRNTSRGSAGPRGSVVKRR
jgi:hypothetical protein